ncbi:MAG: BON domain-containing protein [Methyloprofundus sp.]|nr:BON domain-containing protein [Methyloprofundus sp.]
MKQSLILLFFLILTACSSIGHDFAELTGLSYLYDRRESAAIATDERIEDSAIVVMHKLSDIKQKAHVNMTSYNAKVLITGEVESEDILERIISNVRIIPGIKLVHNELIIARLSSVQSRNDDSLLTIRVKDALAKIEGMPGFDATYVKVISEKQSVYLMGLVSEEEGAVAAETVQRIGGVKKVVTVFEYIDYAKIKNK